MYGGAHSCIGRPHASSGWDPRFIAGVSVRDSDVDNIVDNVVDKIVRNVTAAESPRWSLFYHFRKSGAVSSELS